VPQFEHLNSLQRTEGSFLCHTGNIFTTETQRTLRLDGKAYLGLGVAKSRKFETAHLFYRSTSVFSVSLW
jgi:hypothetical protein